MERDEESERVSERASRELVKAGREENLQALVTTRISESCLLFMAEHLRLKTVSWKYIGHCQEPIVLIPKPTDVHRIHSLLSQLVILLETCVCKASHLPTVSMHVE